MLASYYTEWIEHDCKTVLIDGIAHVLRVRTWYAVYPYEHESISVSAEPKNKRAKWYVERKRELGDDFSTDVLASDCELQVAILEQLKGDK